MFNKWNSMTPAQKKAWGIGALAVFLAIVLFSIFSHSTSQPSPVTEQEVTSDSVENQQTQRPQIKITAEQLMQEYRFGGYIDSNPDPRFKGKELIVTGTISVIKNLSHRDSFLGMNLDQYTKVFGLQTSSPTGGFVGFSFNDQHAKQASIALNAMGIKPPYGNMPETKPSPGDLPDLRVGQRVTMVGTDIGEVDGNISLQGTEIIVNGVSVYGPKEGRHIDYQPPGNESEAPVRQEQPPTQAQEQKNAREDRELRVQIAKEIGIPIDESGKLGGTPKQGAEWAIEYVKRTGKPITIIFNDVSSGKAVVTEKFEMENGEVVARDVGGPNAHEDQINNAVPQQPRETPAEKQEDEATGKQTPGSWPEDQARAVKTPPVSAYSPTPGSPYQSVGHSAPNRLAQYYWYYCRNPQGYYPYVTSCPGGWVQVIPMEQGR